MKNKKIDISKFSLPNAKLARKRLEQAKIIKKAYKPNKNMVNFGKNKTFFIRTYGCQSNVRDSETMKGICYDMNYSESNDIYNADLVILNTCAVRENAENKVFGELGLLKSVKNKNPNMILGISGCMGQSEAVVNKILTKYQHVDFVIGTHNIHELANILERVKYEKQMIVDVWSQEGNVIEDTPVARDNKIKAWVNIMYGCDKFCTYCIVPYTRGKIRSRRIEDIIDEVNNLIKNGYSEVTLLGQNVNAYGKDFVNEDINFVQLLEAVALTGIKRIRFATSNPWNWNNQIIDIAKKYENIMPYFHLPIQSGSENILKKMNREMKISDYIKKIEYIRKNLPSCAITTDLIVGFPNETDEEFNDTLNLYKKIKYDNAYTFIYSKRENTPAAVIDDKVEKETKKQRLAKLNELVKKYAKENNEKFVNQIVEVLVEGNSKSNPNKLTGYSREWKVVNFEGKANPGEFVEVKITSASRFSLNGKQI